MPGNLVEAGNVIARSMDDAIDQVADLEARDRPRYAAELSRVLRPGGKLLLRASLYAAGVRNDIDENVTRRSRQNG